MPMRSTSGTSSLTTLWRRRRSARASVLRPSPAPCVTSSHSDGCGPNGPMSARIPSASTISPGNFSSAARWPTMSRTFSLDDIAKEAVAQKHLDWFELLEQEPDAGLGNGGLGRLAACFLDSLATMQLPAMGYGLRYEYGIFKQSIQDGWQHELPDNWLRRPDPWEVQRPHETVDVKLNCSFELRGGSLRAVIGCPSSLIGVPFDRPVVGYGGKTINTLRLWAAAAHDYFNFQEFSSGDFVGALAETLEAESLTRVLYPDDSTSQGQGLRFVQEYFLVACSLADLLRRFRRDNTDWSLLPVKVAIQLN